MSSFKSSENIQKKEGGPDRSDMNYLQQIYSFKALAIYIVGWGMVNRRKKT